MSETLFANKVAFVTGATSGIGRACALAFAGHGAKVACVGRKDEALEDVMKEIKARGSKGLKLKADLVNDEAVDYVLAQTVTTYGGIDIVVNAAGHISNGTIETTSMQSWEEMLNINVRAIFHLIQKALPTLIERKGNIVNVSSVNRMRGYRGVLAYCV